MINSMNIAITFLASTTCLRRVYFRQALVSCSWFHNQLAAYSLVTLYSDWHCVIRQSI